ncbi:MAG TPA: xanthine dehydrogenase family protein subunit M [Edaphobacter sp.]|jgi:xanthine dehydrogenase YagS FAD-binding subunit|nr:xanthine dehydrogenase family protein subunit M [Edaphobacter sp.]
MNPFQYQRATSPDEAVHAVSVRGAKFLGGGTNLVDLMKYNVEHPSTLIDVTHVGFDQIATTGTTTIVGAGVRNSDLANHEAIRTNYPLLSQALLSGASPQLRNMATTGGNLMQRTRCYYFMDTAFPACNKRTPGSGCAAIKGFNRIHAILGASGGSEGHTECIATNPSDMSVALAALNATIHVTGPKGKRIIPITDFHRLPGDTPNIDTNLKSDELITAVELPAPKFAKHSYYLKVRDRQSYAFALVSVAAGLEINGNTIRSAGLALGGVAHKPWHSSDAEKSLIGATASSDAFRRAADLAVAGAVPREHNAFKIELAKQSIVRAFTLAAQGVQA